MSWNVWFSLFFIIVLEFTEVSMDGLSCSEAVEGDIITDRSTLKGPVRRRVSRAATAFKKRLWLNDTVPYVIGPFFSNATRLKILKGMATWRKYTCIRFVPRTNQKDYVDIRLRPGCCSSVGRVGGKQHLFLGNGCHGLPVILHELGHLIGFWHEQTRPDRDDYIEVLHKNILPSKKHNFLKQSTDVINSLDQIFDYESIMLYGYAVFSKYLRRTLKPKVTRFVWKQQGGIDYFQLHTSRGARKLSAKDIIQANLLYKCPYVHENGGILVGSHGNLTSPNYPKPYPRSRDFAWTILPKQIRPQEMLTIVFEEFSVGSEEPDGECRGDYLEVREGKGELAPYLVKLCGTKVPYVLTVFHDSLYLQLHSTNESIILPTTKPTPALAQPLFYWRRVQKKEKRFGFLLRYKISDCKHVLKAHNGTIQTPNYPAPYAADTDCVWQISVAEGNRIHISFEDFDFRQVNSESGCLDYLEMREGTKPTSKFLSLHCGRDFPTEFSTNANHLRIFMHSGRGKAARGTGFRARYKAVDIDECNAGGVNPCEQGCLNTPGGYFCGCYEGYFTVRDNPKHVSCVDIDECEINNGGCSHRCTNTHGGYFCSCPVGFYLENDGKTCQDSDECKLSLCSQQCTNNPGSYRCSCYLGYLLDIDGKSCILAIRMCTGVLSSPVGKFTSPAIPIWYQGSVDCEWTVRVRQRYTIGVYLSLAWSRDIRCSNYLKFSLDEGKGMHSLQFCGREDMEGLGLLHFKAHEIRIHYHVQAPYPEGFSLRYHMRPKKEDLCGGVLNSPKGILQSPRYPSTYPSRAVCLWKIINPQGKHVLLSFETFELEKESHCKYDYLDIQTKDGSFSNIRPIGRFCGNIKPPVIRSRKRELWVTFRSDGTVQRKGFRASYIIK